MEKGRDSEQAQPLFFFSQRAIRLLLAAPPIRWGRIFDFLTHATVEVRVIPRWGLNVLRQKKVYRAR